MHPFVIEGDAIAPLVNDELKGLRFDSGDVASEYPIVAGARHCRGSSVRVVVAKVRPGMRRDC
jgi:hypothetical protein